ncbi:hypothetical protein D4Z78_24520 [Okeania hirsuta]|nr:hypothetical protein D4Z78_24520 [Okeania hirsuta]
MEIASRLDLTWYQRNPRISAKYISQDGFRSISDLVASPRHGLSDRKGMPIYLLGLMQLKFFFIQFISCQLRLFKNTFIIIWYFLILASLLFPENTKFIISLSVLGKI